MRVFGSALQRSVLSAANKDAKRRVLKTRHNSSKQRLNDQTAHLDQALSAVLTGQHAKAQLLHHRTSETTADGLSSATNMMAKYDQECEALTRRLNLNSVARSEALAARLQQKRREMAERAVSMERLHQWILAQPVKEGAAAEADAQQDQVDEKTGTPHSCEVL